MTKLYDHDRAYLILAKVGATFGIKGWVKLHSFSQLLPEYFDIHPWFIADDPKNQRKAEPDWQPIQIEESKVHSDKLLIKFKGIDTPEAAKLFTGKVLALTRDQLPPLEQDDYYWSDLVGLTVIDKEQNPLGKVIYLLETGSNDVLVVKGKTEFAIPYLPNEVIIKVDLKDKTIMVNWEPI